MKECYITNRDIQTRFNPIFHALKIAHIKKEIEEMYHAGTTITNYDYSLGFMNTRSLSAEDVAIDILSKRETLDNRIERHERYISIHDQAIEKIGKFKTESIVLQFQSGAYTYEDVGQIFGLSKERISQILKSYKRAVSDIITKDDADSEPISKAEVQQLSAVIESSVMFVPEPPDKTLDPLHGLADWLQRDNERRRKRRAEMSAV